MEINWKTIKNFSGYMVSNTGLLKSLNYKRSGKEQILKPSDNGGYLQTMIKGDDGKYYSRKIHNLITLGFIGVKPKDYTVNHKDGNKLNNHIDNLEYCTLSENCLHAVQTGLWEIKHGSKNGNSKLTEQDVLDIRTHVKNSGRYYGRKALAEKYGVSEAHIKDIISKRRNIWKYVDNEIIK
jgi:hypothetical protein